MMKHFVLHVSAILLKQYRLLFMPKILNLDLSAVSCPKYTDINIYTLYLNVTI